MTYCITKFLLIGEGLGLPRQVLDLRTPVL